ncbi:MAG: MarR family transcriptional regulator [Hyphomicrobiales bacterium]|nr:MarR family transcriptional regulator [Hyphomicrobiales bacterium]
MPVELKPAQGLNLLHDIALAMVRETRPDGMADFTHRQLAILLTVYLEQPPHTVRGLAHKLGVTKPVITRALDSMGKQAIVARRRDETDKRNVIIQRTVKGALYVEKLGDMVVQKASDLPVPDIGL